MGAKSGRYVLRSREEILAVKRGIQECRLGHALGRGDGAVAADARRQLDRIARWERGAS